MVRVSFTVPGIPAPQGSKKPYGGEDNPRTHPWRGLVAMMCPGRAAPLEGPIHLQATFTFPRPKSHYGTGRNAGIVKHGAPVWHTSKPDTDKLLRAIGDALTGVLWKDDSQIVNIRAIKIYGAKPGAHILVEGS